MFEVLHFLVVVGAICAAFYVLLARPMLLVRLPLWLLAHSVYRVRTLGRGHVPATGPALLVCNHVGYLDWLFILAGQRRHVHFVIFAGWTKVWGLRQILKWAGVIPIDKWAGPRGIVKSLQLAAETLKRGELVCIFAEGRFTRTGFLLPFHRGFEQIVKHFPAPIIPVCLEHVWGSIFSYRGGKLIWKWPQELPYPVTVAYGAPLPATTRAAEVRQAIQKLSADCAIQRPQRRRLVHRQLVRLAARHSNRPCIIDSTLARPLSYGQVFVQAMCLARQIKPFLALDSLVGIWLPPGVQAVTANIALALLRKTTVNLSYTSAPEAVQAALRQANLRHVLTSQAFLAQVPLPCPPGLAVVPLEKVTIADWHLRLGYLMMMLLPGILLERWVLGLRSHRTTDLATVLFTAGTVGPPKGVMLSHANIRANVESIIQILEPRPEDRVLGVLPFHYAYGYTMTLWLPLQVGAAIIYHADARQGRVIGALCRKHKATIFLATPTVLRACLEECEPDDFATLRFLWCGGAKMPAALAEAFHKKFGIVPLEGYGATELSPVFAANVPDQEMDGFRQIGNKPGTVGQPLPGVAGRIVDPATFAPLPPGQEGLLLAYGPSVMTGYLGRPDATGQAMRDGWYITGDIARYDEDGFLTICGRKA